MYSGSHGEEPATAQNIHPPSATLQTLCAITVVLVIAAVLPLVLNPWGYNAFEFTKAALLRGFALMGMFVAVLELTGKRRNHPSELPLVWPAILFGLVLVLVTAFSVDRHLNLWGSCEGQQGLVTLGAYLALFLVTGAGLRTRGQAARLWAVLV